MQPWRRFLGQKQKFSSKKFVPNEKTAIFAHRNRKRTKVKADEQSSRCSAARLAHLLWEQGVPSSNLGISTKPVLESSGCSAVRLARQLRELEVAGSNPVSPTRKVRVYALAFFLFLTAGNDSGADARLRSLGQWFGPAARRTRTIWVRRRETLPYPLDAA